MIKPDAWLVEAEDGTPMAVYADQLMAVNSCSISSKVIPLYRRAEPAGLRELVEKWRCEAFVPTGQIEDSWKAQYRRCADELEAALANTEPAWRGLEIDAENDTVTIEGIKFAGGLFEDLSKITPEGQALRVINTDNGVCTVQTVRLANTEPSVPVSRWILCSDRLPEVHGDYITYQTGYKPVSAGVQSMYFNPDLEYPWTEEDDSTPVIAWMPKPEPPITEARSHEI